MWPCKSVVCRIEMQTVSGSSAAAALASVGKAPSNPVRPASFRKSRRVQDLYGGDIASSPCASLTVNQSSLQLKRRADAAQRKRRVRQPPNLKATAGKPSFLDHSVTRGNCLRHNSAVHERGFYRRTKKKP